MLIIIRSFVPCPKTKYITFKSNRNAKRLSYQNTKEVQVITSHTGTEMVMTRHKKIIVIVIISGLIGILIIF